MFAIIFMKSVYNYNLKRKLFDRFVDEETFKESFAILEDETYRPTKK